MGNSIIYEYDSLGRIIATRAVGGDDSLETTSTYDAVGQLLTTTDALGRTTEYRYDPLGQVVETIFSDGTTIQREYDAFGNLIAETDQEGRVTRREYDALDRLTAVVDVNLQRTEYAYNELGNLISIIDANEHTTRFEYDGLGRRIATERPLNQRTEFTYNKVGSIISVTDFNGSVIEYQYDDVNRLIAKNLPGTDPFVEYGYSEGNLFTSVQDARGETTYTYDEQGLLLSRTEPNDAEISYTYNEADLLETVTTPSGTTTYYYDGLNRLEKVDGPLSNDDTVYQYDEVGNLETITYANGVVETREYDALNRWDTVVYTNPEGDVIASYDYTYDKVGNITNVQELNGREVRYTYNELYRLTQEEITDPIHGNQTTIYTYDPVGNRETETISMDGTVVESTTYDYDDNDRIIETVTNGVVTTYIYDNNGNLKLAEVQGSPAQTAYVWDLENRLVEVLTTDGAGALEQVEYVYDADGRRVASTVDGVETRYLIDTMQPYDQVVVEYTVEGGSYQTQASYLYGADLISQHREGETLFYLEDRHSGVRQLADASGTVTDTYSYDAYGNVLESTGDSENNYLYRGEQFDPNADLQYLRARYYDPSVGRFASTDPFEGMLETPVSLHRYLYGNANPITFHDPSGKITKDTLLALDLLSILGAGVLGAFQLSGSLASRYLLNEEQIRWSGWNIALELLDLSPGGPQAAFLGLPVSFFGHGIGGTFFSPSSEVYQGIRLEDLGVIALHRTGSIGPQVALFGTATANFTIGGFSVQSSAGFDLVPSVFFGTYASVALGFSVGRGAAFQPLTLGFSHGNASGCLWGVSAGFALNGDIGISAPFPDSGVYVQTSEPSPPEHRIDIIPNVPCF